MKKFIPSELDKETFEKYKNIIELNKIINIFLIKDENDIQENTYIEDDNGHKIFVSKYLIKVLPINEYFTIVCTSRANESCKTYKVMSLEKLLEEYNSIREDEELNNNLEFHKDIVKETNKESSRIEFPNYGDEEDKYLSQESSEYEDVDDSDDISLEEFDDDLFDEDNNEEY